MKYTGRKGFSKILTILIVLSILLQNNGVAFASSSENAEIASPPKEREAATELSNGSDVTAEVPKENEATVELPKESAASAEPPKENEATAELPKESAAATEPPKETVEPSKEQIIIGEGDTAQEYETLPAKVQYAGKTHKCSIPVIKWDNVWMAPAKIVFSDILGCYYEDSKEKKSVLVTNPDKGSSIQFTLDSKKALLNNKEKSLPAAVTTATKKNSEKSDYMIPLEFTMKSLGYTYSVKGTSYYLLEVQQKYLYYITAKDLSYDKEKYSNMLIGVVLQANTTTNQNIIQGFSRNSASKKNVKIVPNVTDYSVTIQFLNTYNPFGKVTKSIKNGITKSIKVWETEDRTTCVQVTYNHKKEYTSKITANGGTITLSKGSFSMKVLLPEKVTYSQVTTSDQYWKQKFLITVPGNHVSFYKTYAPVDNSSYVTGISVSKTANKKNTQITVSTKGLKGYKLTKGNGYFTVQVGNPKDIYENIVLIDAGHGGKDSGAVKNGLKEKDLNLKIGYKLMNEYFEKKSSTVKAYWTRHDDTFINLYARPTYSTKYQADLFVSLHMNSAGSSSANGTEVYYSQSNNSKSFSGITSKLFAQKMKNNLVNTLGMKDRGVKQAGFVVIKYNKVPSILIELGFVTGGSDSKKLKKETFQKKAAKTIYEGICSTFKSYPTKR